MRFLPALAVLSFVSTAALAQPGPDGQMAPPPPGMNAPEGQAMPPGPGPQQHMNMRQRFEAANTTRDGKLTREQAEAGGMRNVARLFDQIDTDRKGYVTLQDLRAWGQARRAQRAQQQQQQPGQQ